MDLQMHHENHQKHIQIRTYTYSDKTSGYIWEITGMFNQNYRNLDCQLKVTIYLGLVRHDVRELNTNEITLVRWAVKWCFLPHTNIT